MKDIVVLVPPADTPLNEAVAAQEYVKAQLEAENPVLVVPQGWAVHRLRDDPGVFVEVDAYGDGPLLVRPEEVEAVRDNGNNECTMHMRSGFVFRVKMPLKELRRLIEGTSLEKANEPQVETAAAQAPGQAAPGIQPKDPAPVGLACSSCAHFYREFDPAIKQAVYCCHNSKVSRQVRHNPKTSEECEGFSKIVVGA